MNTDIVFIRNISRTNDDEIKIVLTDGSKKLSDGSMITLKANERDIKFEYGGKTYRSIFMADENKIVISDWNNPLHGITQVYAIDDLGRVTSRETKNGNIREVCNFTYTNGQRDYKIEKIFYQDEIPIAKFDRNDVYMISLSDGSYSFQKDNEEILHIFPDGKRFYVENNIVLHSNGTYESPSGNGTYKYDENGNIYCLDTSGSEYVYNEYGKLIQEKEDNKIINYNYKLKSKEIINNNSSSFSMINHVEYDEESYNKLMQGLMEVDDEYSNNITTRLTNSYEIISNLPDKYDNIDSYVTSENDIKKHINEINMLKNNINYSLLAYQTCDKELEYAARNLIDDLFDEEEKNIAKLFKYSISSTIEDKDKDGILEYREGTDFNKLYQNAMPVFQYCDDNGDIWYFNYNNCLMGTNSKNPIIKYGNEEFKVTFTDNGIVKLVDTKGNPINIYGDYNFDSCQYGGNQSDFYNHASDLLCDENIIKILDEFFPNSNMEERKSLLASVASNSCAMVGITNAVFKHFEGNEEGFYNTFSYPMYNILYNPGGQFSVDFNYEPLTLELSLEKNFKYSDDKARYLLDSNTGTYDLSLALSQYGMPTYTIGKNGITSVYSDIYTNFFKDKYGLNITFSVAKTIYNEPELQNIIINDIGEIASEHEHIIIISSGNDDVKNGKWSVQANGEEPIVTSSGHAMYYVDSENNTLNVSTWGKREKLMHGDGAKVEILAIDFD